MIKFPDDFEDKVLADTEELLRRYKHDPDKVEQAAISGLSMLSRRLNSMEHGFDSLTFKFGMRMSSSRFLQRCIPFLEMAFDQAQAGTIQFVGTVRTMINVNEWAYDKKGGSSSPMLREFHDRVSRLTEKELNDPAALVTKLLKGLDAYEASSVHHRIKNFKL